MKTKDESSSNTCLPFQMTCIRIFMMRNLICLHVSQVFHNVHFRHFGKLKLRFLLKPKLINRLCLVHIFGYIWHIWHHQQSTTSKQKLLQRNKFVTDSRHNPNMVSKTQMLKSSNMQTQISMRKKSKHVSHISRWFKLTW